MVESNQAPKRLALVIGNAAYTVGALKNPVNDARAVAQALREMDYDVIYRETEATPAAIPLAGG